MLIRGLVVTNGVQKKGGGALIPAVDRQERFIYHTHASKYAQGT